MNLYISDLHFGHTNAIKFDHRPFADRDEMDHAMIQLWNSRVSADDDVYIVGDFCFKSDRSPNWYLRQLKGHKHLIVGNHDKVILNCEKAAKYLESIEKMMYVTDGDKKICLCHYPIGDWYNCRHGSWHIYGHIHGDKGDVYQLMKTREHALNAAACINNYMPASINELIRNNKAFWEKDEESKELLFVAKNKVTGEEFLFGFTDLYGYEGEVCGIIFRDGRTVFAENDGLRSCALNPDFEIRLAGEEDKNCRRIK